MRHVPGIRIRVFRSLVACRRAYGPSHLACRNTDINLTAQDGKTRCTTGSVVSSLYHLKDTENQNQDAGFFVFPDLSVRTEGSYRLKLSLFEVVGSALDRVRASLTR